MVGGHHVVERAKQRERLEAAVRRLLPLGAQAGRVIFVLAGEARPPRDHGAGVELQRFHGRRQQLERFGGVALEINVGV